MSDALDATPGVAALRDKVSATVTLTRRSSTAKECLEECESLVGMTPFKPLIQDVATRWNSLCLVCERFHHLKESLMLFFVKMQSENRLSPTEWDLIATMVSPLKPCFKSTTEMSGDQYFTGSKFIPMVKSMLGFYAEEQSKLQRGAEGDLKLKLCSKILAKLSARFGVIEGVRELAISSPLDPCFKQHSFRNTENKKCSGLGQRRDCSEGSTKGL